MNGIPRSIRADTILSNGDEMSALEQEGDVIVSAVLRRIATALTKYIRVQMTIHPRRQQRGGGHFLLVALPAFSPFIFYLGLVEGMVTRKAKQKAKRKVRFAGSLVRGPSTIRRVQTPYRKTRKSRILKRTL